MSTNIRFNVNAAKLRLAASCKATLDIRYYLNGVYIEPREEGGVYMVGTDGHRMIAVIDETGATTSPVIVSLDKETIKALPLIDETKRENWRVTLSEHSDEGTHGLLTVRNASGLVVHVQSNAEKKPIIDGIFPDWRRASKLVEKVEEGKRGFVGQFNARLLEAPLNCFAAQRTTAMRPIELFANHEESAITVRFVGHDYVAMTVMPMRQEGDRKHWITAWSHPSALPRPPRDKRIDNALSIAFASLTALEQQGLLNKITEVTA